MTVSATVTNTGQVAGSDVAQLYLGDPAAAGEPPRQLKGFQKVTLQPGQSTTVHFTLTGHDLSYWDDAANGWVVPDGDFGVYVGDSSALANLPLRGGFTVDRTVGARYATLSRPGHGDAGHPRHGHRHPGQRRRLRDAAGAVHAAGPGRLDRQQPGAGHGGAGADRHRALHRDRARQRAARRPAPCSVSIRSAARRPFGGRSGVVEASATVTVPYSSLAAAYNNTGISDNSNAAAADYDGVGDSYSAQALAAGTPTPLTPGGQVTIGGTTLTWPSAAPGTPDNVVTGGQTVAVSGSGNRPRVPRRQPERHRQRHGHGALHRRQQPVLQPQHGGLVRQQPRRRRPAPDHHLELELHSSRPRPPTRSASTSRSVPLQQGKQVSSVTLPVLSNAGGTTAMHIFSMATGTGTPDDRSAVLLARRRLRQRRDHRQLRPRARATSTAPGRASRPRRWPPARPPRSPRAARPPSAGPRSPGPPPSARPTT